MRGYLVGEYKFKSGGTDARRVESGQRTLHYGGHQKRVVP
jgi:hypothetical protein